MFSSCYSVLRCTICCAPLTAKPQDAERNPVRTGELECPNGHPSYPIVKYVPDMLIAQRRAVIADLRRDAPSAVSRQQLTSARRWLEERIAHSLKGTDARGLRQLEQRLATLREVTKRHELTDKETRDVYAIAASHAMSAGYRRNVADQLYGSLYAVSYERYEDILLRLVVNNCLALNDCVLIELGSGVGRLLHQYASCVSSRPDACRPYRRAGSALYDPSSLPNGHRLRLMVGVDFEEQMLRRAMSWFRESKVAELATVEGRMLQILASASEAQIDIDQTVYAGSTKIVCVLFQTLGNQLGADLQADLVRHAVKLAAPHGLVFVSAFNGVAFDEQATPYYDDIRRSVGSVMVNDDRLFLSSKGVYSRWFDPTVFSDLLHATTSTEVSILDESSLGVFSAYSHYIDLNSQAHYRKRALIGVIGVGMGAKDNEGLLNTGGV